MASTPVLLTLLAALTQIQYPSKDVVWNLFENLGFEHQTKFPGYKFLRRGGLSSPHVQYVTDADLIFNNPKGGLVRVEDFDVLCTLASQLFDKHVYAARIVRDQEVLVDEEIADVGELRSVVQEGCDVATLAGMFRLQNGWCVPVDLTLQCGESRMTKDERIKRIMGNLEKNDFAKVISRIRAILPKQHKAGFAEAWNREGGALRFLVKQLHLSKKMSTVQQEVYLREYLLLDPCYADDWANLAEMEMQRRAEQLLESYKDLVRDALTG